MTDLRKINNYKIIILLGFLIYFIFSIKEIGNFYQSGHAGFINAEVGQSELNTINNGFLKTKFGSTKNRFIYNRAPEKDEYYVRYPYLLPFMVSALWKITGPSEIAARLFAIIFVFASFFVFYLIAKELDYSNLSSTLVFFSLCSFPIFYHYAGLANGEILTLFPLALSYYFYLKFLKKGKNKYKYFLLISLSVACQLFWYGYLAAFVIFIDSLVAFFIHKDKRTLKLNLALAITVIINMAIYLAHTFWLVGNLKDVISAFLWRASIEVPPNQRFSWIEFIIKNIKRWWLFNPATILLAFANILFFFFKIKQKPFFSLKKRFHFLLLITPMIFIFFLSHLVHYHDFLLIYFSFFLALSSLDIFSKILKKFTWKKGKNYLLYSYIFILLIFAVIGLIKNPEEKLIDKDTDNYELYYVCKTVRNITRPEDKIILTLKRIQEPQVRFYLRRESDFVRVMKWAKGYVDSGVYSYYLVEDKQPYRPLVKYLLQNYRAHKFDRYFLFNLKKPGKGLKALKREKKETNFFFKYFVSPYHQPGKYKEIKSQKQIKKIYSQYEKIEDLYPSF